MKIKYFADTDTALLELGDGAVAETRELSEDIYLDLDAAGHVVSMTVEHASRQMDLTEVSFMQMNQRTTESLGHV
ncbi:MAG: DUF2283 domain-containing protein [Phycisphaerales bacterium]|nr:DUF2283 domain-containing protein [Phycisphaerales bacterium]